MSSQERDVEKNCIRTVDEKQYSWIPETPVKPNVTVGVVGGGSTTVGVVEGGSTTAKHKVLDGVTPLESNSSNDGCNSPDDVEYYPPSSKKRKNNNGQANEQPSKAPKRKIYRPKVFSDQMFKRTTKSKVKSKNTPKPSTPKQKRNYVRKRGSLCNRKLFDEDSISLPFIKNFDLEAEQSGFDSIVNNHLGIKYNSLQSYQQVSSLSSLCLVEARRAGANFPSVCKKKRIRRKRVCLEKLLTPIVKGVRSKSFIRKGKIGMAFKLECKASIDKKLIARIKKIRSLKKKVGRTNNELLVYNESRQLVPYKQSSPQAVVLLDEETLRVWNLLKDGKKYEEDDEMKQKHWENIRIAYRIKVEKFLDIMHCIQGNRRFYPWKGSVLDSVVGAFLTQNVSDHLSSSAFMNLAARFPIKATRYDKSNEDLSSPIVKEKEDSKIEEIEVEKVKESSKLDNMGSEKNSKETEPLDMASDKKNSKNRKKNMNEEEKDGQRQKWDALRKKYTNHTRHSDHMDSVDWEAVRCAQASEVAAAIEIRGQHHVIAGRIQRFLNSLMDSYGNLDLEWLRHIPPQDAKEYLLSIYGLGLKSVECIRLLTLHHVAFPVDINVARIGTRLEWVPIQPLPESIQIHNLEVFPDPIKMQQYLWPRLCNLDQPTLYELHYQLITFGKVFCTKKNPNCRSCPLKGECKYFASVVASTKLPLPGPTSDQRIIMRQTLEPPTNSSENSVLLSNSAWPFIYEGKDPSINKTIKECEPIIEMPASPLSEGPKLDELEENNDADVCDYVGDIATIKSHDCVCEDIEDISTIKLKCSQETYDGSLHESEDDMSKSTALVAIHLHASNTPVPKMKIASRLKTERLVYKLPDNHRLLVEHAPREAYDPFHYLLVVWTKGELEGYSESTKNNFQEEESNLTVPGTLLIPCRTAMRGHFPLNGTYFQVNEVFADYASMINPINVPRKWLWNLEKRTVYFGTGISAIMRGLSLDEICNNFCRDYVCVRAMDAKTRASKPISSILHRNTTKLGKENKTEELDE